MADNLSSSQLAQSMFCLAVQDRFEQNWQTASPMPLPEFWRAMLAGQPLLPKDARQELLLKLIHIDLEYRWGTRAKVAASGKYAGRDRAVSLAAKLSPVERWLLEDYAR